MVIADPEAVGGERVKIVDFGIAEVRSPIVDGESALFFRCGKAAERLLG